MTEKKKISTLELSELIHKFHNGVTRDLWSFYMNGHTEMVVRQAIENGTILKAEISPGILERLR